MSEDVAVGEMDVTDGVVRSVSGTVLALEDLPAGVTLGFVTLLGRPWKVRVDWEGLETALPELRRLGGMVGGWFGC